MILIPGLLVIMAVREGNCIVVKPTQEPPALCLNSARLYPDNEDCRKFYRCVNRKLVPMSCPAKTAFDVSTQTCDWRQVTSGCSLITPDSSTATINQMNNRPNKRTTNAHIVNRTQNNNKWGNAKMTIGVGSSTTASVQQKIIKVYPEKLQEKTFQMNNKSNPEFVKASDNVRTVLNLGKLDTNHVVKIKPPPVTVKPAVTSLPASTKSSPNENWNKWYQKIIDPEVVIKTVAPSTVSFSHIRLPISHNSQTDLADHVTKISIEANTNKERKDRPSDVDLKKSYKEADNNVTTVLSYVASQQTTTKTTSSDSSGGVSVSLSTASTTSSDSSAGVSVSLSTAKLINAAAEGNGDETHTEDSNNNNNKRNYVIGMFNNTVRNGSTFSTNGTLFQHESLVENIQINTQHPANFVMTTTHTFRKATELESDNGTDNFEINLESSHSNYRDQELNRTTKFSETNSTGVEHSGNKSIPLEDLSQLIQPYRARVYRKFYKTAAEIDKDGLRAQLKHIKDGDVNADHIWTGGRIKIPAAIFERMTGKIVNRDQLLAMRIEKAKPRWYDPEASPGTFISNTPKTASDVTTSSLEILKSEPNSLNKNIYLESVRFAKLTTEIPLAFLRHLGTTTSRESDEKLTMSRDGHTLNHTRYNPKTHTGKPSTSGDLTDTDLEGSNSAVDFTGASATESASARNLNVNFMSAPYLVTGLIRPFRCPQPDGHFPDSKNCAVYYHCSRGHAYRRDCPPGQVFHQGVHACVSSRVAPPCPSAYLSSSQENRLSKISVCESPNGLFRDEISCNHYFECTDGAATRRRCLEGTVFDVVMGKCSWSKFVPGCQQKANSKVKVDISDHGHDRFQCPQDGYFRNPESCDVYYLCVGGKAQRMTCDPETSFDVTLNMCVWSHLVDGCKGNSDLELAAILDSNSLDGDDQMDDIKPGTLRQPSDQQETGALKQSSGQQITGAIRQSTDQQEINAFIKSSDQKGALRQSSDQQETGALKQSSGHQQIGALTQSTNQQQIGALRQSTDQEIHAFIKSSDQQETVALRKLSDQQETVALRKLSDQKETGSLRKLSDQQETVALRKLSDQQETVALRKLSDQQETVALIKSSDQQETSDLRKLTDQQETVALRKLSDQQETSVRKLSSDQQETDQTKSSHPFSCPEAHGLYSDPNHCSFFIHCFKTVAYRHQCQPGTVFSTKHAACTWQQLVGECQDTVDIKTAVLQELKGDSLRHSKEGPKSIQTETYKQLLSVSETARYKVQPVGLQEFKCPAVEDGFYRDSLFCDIFHRCVHGSKFTFTCPAGTFFRLEDNLCDFWDTIKDCTQDGVRIEAMGKLTKVEPSPGSLQVPQPGQVQFDDVSLVSIDGDPTPCPEASGLFPHPRNCHQFLFCTHFVPLVLTCPESLLYNPQSLTCDFPNKVQCFRYDN